jgi:hypothetical protein
MDILPMVCTKAELVTGPFWLRSDSGVEYCAPGGAIAYTLRSADGFEAVIQLPAGALQVGDKVDVRLEVQLPVLSAGSLAGVSIATEG